MCDRVILYKSNLENNTIQNFYVVVKKTAVNINFLNILHCICTV